MSQCVPSWDLDDNNPTTHVNRFNLRSNSNSIPPDDSTLDNEVVAELIWENGQLAMHGLGQPRVPVKPFPSSATKYTWEKPRAGGTLESIVDQATSVPKIKLPFNFSGGNELVPWFEHHRAAAAAAARGGGASATVTMDAMVPCSNRPGNNDRVRQQLDSVPGSGTCVPGCSTRVGSCSGAATHENENEAKKRDRVARVPTAAHEWSSRAPSMSGSATFERDSRQVTADTCDRDCALGFTSTNSAGSPENTSSDKPYSKTTTTDHDSVAHSRRQTEVGKDEEKKKGNRKSSLSIKRSRAAAIHNQSEREVSKLKSVKVDKMPEQQRHAVLEEMQKRRDKINQRMKTLQKMVPNSSKTDKASMLDEVIEYLKQLQAQVNVMRGINMSPMMLPLAMQQQLQMQMMAPMGMGMSMGMGMGVMDMNTLGRHNMTGISPVLHPTAFMPLPSWDGSGDRLAVPMTDPLSTFAACQSQPMTMDAYSRMAALYQQLHQPPGSSSKI